MLARLLNDFSPLTRLHNEMNRLLEDFFQDLPTDRSFAAGYPAVNLWEDADQACLECELPGMSMDDVEIYVTGNEVTISGQRKIADHPQASWHRRERAGGRFSRTFTLPWEIDADKVQARLQDGVLTVTLPKRESCKPRKIQVQAA